MGYFLKKTNNKKGTYLQIYESFYNPEKKHTSHKSIKPLGYVDDLIKSGISDPIVHYQEVIDEMNEKRLQEKQKIKNKMKLQDQPPLQYYGYFPAKAINEGLGVEKDMAILQLAYGLRSSLFDLLSCLVYARIVKPCSKYRTFQDVIPYLCEEANFSLDQLYAGLSILGNEYKKIIEIYNDKISSHYSRDTSNTYFDCTNLFFEIDAEDSLRRKGPSKENRKSPIVSMGLLLDADCIPLGMKIFPGNQSEKPIYREVIKDLKSRNNISGKTIRIADKGLNCGDNIMDALVTGDGYLFSKSVKTLPEKEKVWVLLDQDYVDVKDKKGNILYRYKSCVDDFEYTYTDANGKKRKAILCEKRVVTYNPKLARKQKREIKKEVDKASNATLGDTKRKEFGDKAKYITVTVSDENGNAGGEKIKLELNNDAINKALQMAGYNMLVTSEIKMDDRKIYESYHNLWRIEESFKVMKSELDARPVYLQDENRIKGHFLMCYISVLLVRLLQIRELNDEFGYAEIMDYMRDAKVVKASPHKTVNLTKKCPVMRKLIELTKLPLDNFYFTSTEIKKIVRYKFKH